MRKIGETHRVTPAALRELSQQNWLRNLKIFPIYGLLIGCGAVAWTAETPWLVWPAYFAMGYLWMSIVTFMHEGTHMILYKKRWKNWAFGIFSTVPILVTFTAFMDDHLAHHRHTRTADDPDAFSMGKRGITDFILFYAYLTIGGILTVVHFNIIYPIQNLRGTLLGIHLGELALRAVVYTGAIMWAAEAGVLAKLLSVWLIPVYIFSVFNSARFVAEHYDTPWDSGQIAGSRTVISNRVHSCFWNNINYHIGHHAYSGVPWYNLRKMHAAMLPEIEAQGAEVEQSYGPILWRAIVGGPESVQRNETNHAERWAALRAVAAVPATAPVE
jgi:fatty acid desaturase